MRRGVEGPSSRLFIEPRLDLCRLAWAGQAKLKRFPESLLLDGASSRAPALRTSSGGVCDPNLIKRARPQQPLGTSHKVLLQVFGCRRPVCCLCLAQSLSHKGSRAQWAAFERAPVSLSHTSSQSRYFAWDEMRLARLFEYDGTDAPLCTDNKAKLSETEAPFEPLLSAADTTLPAPALRRIEDFLNRDRSRGSWVCRVWARGSQHKVG